MLLKGEQQITTQEDRKVPLPYCLFLNNPAFHPLLGCKGARGTEKRRRKQKK